MKKIVISLIFLAIIGLVAFYILIPGRLRIEENTIIKANLPSVYRTLANEDNWKNWWPGSKPFSYNGQTYSIRGKIFNAFDFTIFLRQDSINSMLQLLLEKADSLLVSWNGEIASSINPVRRYLQYRNAVAVKKNMRNILGSLKTFLEKEENIYGFLAIETKVMDSVLIATRSSFDHKPGIEDIDGMIQRLKKYIALNKATEKNYPMLNILMADSTHFEAMVAIAVDQLLPATKEFAPKLVFKGGNILEAQIQGGPHIIEKALVEFENYRSDHKYTSPAIPYQLLVTDRMKEPDSTKWITKMYYPVF